MNAVSSTSSAGAASAALVPAAAAGTSAAPARSFDDVFRRLSGAAAPDALAAAGSAKSAKAGKGQPSDDEEPTGVEEASGDDHTGTTGMVPVPIPIVLQPVAPAPVPDAAAGTESAAAPLGRGAHRPGGTSLVPTTAAPVEATEAADLPKAESMGEAESGTDGAAQPGAAARHRGGAGLALPGEVRPIGGGRSADARGHLETSARRPDESAAPTTDPTAHAAAVVAQLMAEPAHDMSRALGPPRALSNLIDAPASDGPAPHAPGGENGTAATGPATDAALLVTAAPGPSEVEAPGVPDAAAPRAAIPAPAVGANGAPAPTASPTTALSGAPVDAVPAPGTAATETAPATTATTAATGATAAGAAATMTGIAPSPGARGAHPALAAALRAFQQAGLPTPAGTAGTVPVEDSPAPVPPATTTRVAALAETPVDGRGSASETDRRPLTMPTVAMPAFASELRAAAALTSTAQGDGAPLPTLAHADGESVHAQIVQSLRVQWAGGAGEARVRLRPDYLGEVVATIKVEQGTVTATLQADRPEVRKWMEDNTQTLREALVEHGLKLDRLVVQSEAARGDASEDKQGRSRARQQTPHPRPRRPRQDDGGATFELTT